MGPHQEIGDVTKKPTPVYAWPIFVRRDVLPRVPILRMARELKIGDAQKHVLPNKDASLCFLRCLLLGSVPT